MTISLNLKKYLAEYIGTFFLVLVAALSANALAIGCILAAMIYMAYFVSGGHFNPAVTLAIFLRKKISGRDALMYMLFQLLGAMKASFIYYLLKGSTYVPAPAMEATSLSAFLVEFSFTLALVLVVLFVTQSKRTEGNSYYGLAIAVTVLAAYSAGVAISGAVLNPAIGLGSLFLATLIDGSEIAHVWLYLFGPLAGALLAVGVFSIMEKE